MRATLGRGAMRVLSASSPAPSRVGAKREGATRQWAAQRAGHASHILGSEIQHSQGHNECAPWEARPPDLEVNSLML